MFYKCLVFAGMIVQMLKVKQSTTQRGQPSPLSFGGWQLPRNHKMLYNIYTTSVQRPRRWSKIVEMLYKCFVFAGSKADLKVDVDSWILISMTY